LRTQPEPDYRYKGVTPFPKELETSLREKLIKIGAKVVSHGRYVTFQLAEVAVPRQMFQEILLLIARLSAARRATRRFGCQRDWL